MTWDVRDEMGRLKDCALDAIVGEYLGGGATRRVYALKHNPELVLKLEFASKQFCNIAEYEVWKEVNGTPLAKYFARVVDIDPWAGALLMVRTRPITEQIFRRRVKELPAFMDDMHWANFGTIGGRIVCHDYGYNLIHEQAVKAARMKKVKHAK
jgi:hypothetical protein